MGNSQKLNRINNQSFQIIPLPKGASGGHLDNKTIELRLRATDSRQRKVINKENLLTSINIYSLYCGSI